MTVSCTPPALANTTLLPVYSGYISIKNTDPGNSLVIPYLGVAGSMRSAPVILPSLTYLANYNLPAPANTSYTIPRPNPESPPPTDSGDQSTQPNVYMELLVGSALVHIDVLQGDQQELRVGSIAGSPQTYVPRGGFRIFFSGLLADGSVLEEGSYSLKVKALRIFGNASKEEEWDVVKTVAFSLKYES